MSSKQVKIKISHNACTWQILSGNLLTENNAEHFCVCGYYFRSLQTDLLSLSNFLQYLVIFICATGSPLDNSEGINELHCFWDLTLLAPRLMVITTTSAAPVDAAVDPFAMWNDDSILL